MSEGSHEHDVYTYEPFTQHAFYEQVNRMLVRQAVSLLPILPADQTRTIVDLGCGTGAVTQMVVDALQARDLDATIIGVEPSADALGRAERALAGSGMEVRLFEGDAADLGRLTAAVDALFFCNAIHLVPDKDEVVTNVSQVLAPGSLFAFNSSFFNGAYAAGTEKLYRLWTVRAIQWLRREHPEVRLARDEKALAMQWLTPEEYEGLLQAHGLGTVHCTLDEVQMNLESFQDIGHYSLFIEGALPGVPLAAGAEALGHGATEAFEELGLTDIPRNWLQVVARSEDHVAGRNRAPSPA